jgi:AcrR family transcriptional regulator
MSPRRREVLDEAARLFHERGYMGTSMDDIADAVGLTKGTLYHHFPSKAVILGDIYEEAVSFVLAHMSELEQQGSATAAVRSIISAIVELIGEHRYHVTVFYQEMRWIGEWLPAKDARAIRKQIREYIDSVERVIQRGIDEGDFRPTDVSVAAYALIGMASWTYQWFEPSRRLSAGAVSEVLAQTFLEGLVVPAARSPAEG